VVVADPRSHRLAVWLALAVTWLWSSSWVLIRVGLDDEQLTPLTFAGLRYGLAAAVLVAAVAVSPSQRRAAVGLGRRDLAWIAALGVVMYAVTQGAQFVAIDNQPAATTSLVLSLTPLLVAAAGARAIGELASPRQLIGASIVAVGAATYFSGDLAPTTAGMIAAVIALVANAIGALAGRSVNRRRHTSALVVTAASMSVGAAVLVIAGLATEGWPTISARAALIIAWLAVVNTAVAFTLWNRSLQHLGALESAGINNAMLVQIALLAWVFLGEQPGVRSIIGIIAVSAGVFFTQTSRG
jgi:drug/metabolite transporter (DMT)-like permease